MTSDFFDQSKSIVKNPCCKNLVQAIINLVDIMMRLCLWLIYFSLHILLQGATADSRDHGKANIGTVHVFVLAGQSNMEGHGDVDTKDHNTHTLSNGTLLYQVHDPRTQHEFQKLWDTETDTWRSLPDVKIWFNEFGSEHGVNGSTIPGVNQKDYSAGDLTVGYGANGIFHNNSIGPELGFGFNLKIPKGDKALIIKTAWGGEQFNSLFYSFA